jgi:hypothetical protein
VLARFKKVSQFCSSFLGLSRCARLSFLSFVCFLQIHTNRFQLNASPLFFYSAYDTLTLPLPQAHLLNLEGIASFSSRLIKQNYEATGVFAFTHNSQVLLHGFYIAPSFFRNTAQTQEEVTYLGTQGWAVSIGRANISYPQSTYRGFVQLTYRQTKADSLDSRNQELVSELQLPEPYQERKSLLLTIGTATTHTDLVSQKKPLLDSEILISLRYDYEKGNFFSWLKGSVFYTSFVDIGATGGWYKLFNEIGSGTNSSVTDAFLMGPRIRGRILKNHLGIDSSFIWPLYRSFDGKALFTSPRFDVSVVMSF